MGEDPALYIPPASRRETLLMNVQLVKVGEDRTLFIPAPTPTLSRKMQFLTVGLHELLYIAVDAAPVTVNPSRIAVASVPLPVTTRELLFPAPRSPESTVGLSVKFRSLGFTAPFPT